MSTKLQLASINGTKIPYDNNTTSSDVFKIINIEIKEEHPGLKINLDPIYQTGKSKEDTYLYILLVDGNCVSYSENGQLSYNNYKENTTYKLTVLAIDKKGKIYKENKEFKISEYTYSKKILDYPIITAHGICNVKVE